MVFATNIYEFSQEEAEIFDSREMKVFSWTLPAFTRPSRRVEKGLEGMKERRQVAAQVFGTFQLVAGLFLAMPKMQLCDIFVHLYEWNHFIVNHVRVSSLSCHYLLAWCIGNLSREPSCVADKICAATYWGETWRLLSFTWCQPVYLLLTSLPAAFQTTCSQAVAANQP